MKGKFFLFAACALSIFYVSCSKYDLFQENKENKVPVEFSSSINNVKTLVSGLQWDPNDSIGIYMFKSNSPIDSSLEKNTLFKTALGDGNFSSDKTVYYPDNGDNVDFIAYYPYSKTLDAYTLKVNVFRQADFLYSDNAKKFNNKKPSAALGFNHKMSKIAFVIKRDSDTNYDTDNMKISLSGFYTNANFDLAKARFISKSNLSDIKIGTYREGENTCSSLILLPDTTRSAKIRFILQNNKIFNYPIPDQTIYEGGKKYTYQFILTKENIAVQTAASIEDWIEAPSETIKIKPENNDSSGIPSDSVNIPPTGGDNNNPSTDYRTIFSESFGTANVSNILISKFSKWDMKSPVSYTDATGLSVITSTSTIDNHLRLLANKTGSLRIQGINTSGYKNLRLSFDMCSYYGSSQKSEISVSCNGNKLDLSASPNITFNYNNYTLNGIEEGNDIHIEFYTSGSSGGFDIDNVKISGILK